MCDSVGQGIACQWLNYPQKRGLFDCIWRAAGLYYTYTSSQIRGFESATGVLRLSVIDVRVRVAEGLNNLKID